MTTEGHVECPYCFQPIPEKATRCPHCAGERRRCFVCGKLRPVEMRQKFVGLLRGGTKAYPYCAVCGHKL